MSCLVETSCFLACPKVIVTVVRPTRKAFHVELDRNDGSTGGENSDEGRI